MSYVKNTKLKEYKGQKFYVSDSECLGKKCFAPGLFEHRSNTGKNGSQNTGKFTPICMNNAYHGCPDKTDFCKIRNEERKKEGWKNT